MPQNSGWANHLRNYLEKRDDGLYVYNLGIVGGSTIDLLERIEIEVRVRMAEIIVFAIGINDSEFIYSTNSNFISSLTFESNLKKLYKIAKKFTSKIVFVGLTKVEESKTKPIAWDLDIAYMNERIRKFDKIIKNFCLQNSVKFVSTNDLLNYEDLVDGVHPGTKGHIKIFEKIKPIIELMIKS